MEFIINSVGDAAFLEQVLIAVAMICGTGDFEQMVAVGLVVGVMLVTIQSVIQGGKQINIQQVFVGFLIYGCLYAPGARVLIEDSYTGQVRVVDNVPVGIAATGSFISNIGYRLTKLTEQAYGIIVPRLTETEFLESLTILNATRRLAYNSMFFEALNNTNGLGTDLRRSWDNYLRECTLIKIDLNIMPVDDLMRSDIDTALKFDSKMFGTRLFLGQPGGTDYDCDVGWTELRRATGNGLTSPAVDYAVARLLRSNASPTASARNDLNTALGALGQTTVNAQDYMLAAVIEPLYYDAVVGKSRDMLDFNSALMINQAIQQRNTQWAAEQSMFMTIVRPMLTFFEGFVYAITPIVAFIIVMGSFGIQLAGKYVQTVLWIQLWYPVLSIINLFIYTAASNQLTSQVGQLNSMYAVSSAGDVLQHWVATGGMLAAATPIITLFVITGSTYAFTNLASRIGGSDHVNEKQLTPDTATPGAVMQGQPGWTHDRFNGTRAVGAEAMFAGMTLGTAMSSGMASTNQVNRQRSHQFQRALASGLNEQVSHSQGMERLASVNRRFNSGGANESSLVQQHSKDLMSQFGIGTEHAEQVQGAVAAHLAGRADIDQLAQLLLPIAGKAKSLLRNKVKEKTGAGEKEGNNLGDVEAGTKLSAQSSTSDSEKWTAQDISKYMKGLTATETQRQQISDSLEEGFSVGGGERFNQTWGSSNAKNLTQTASEAVAANDSFTRMDDMRQQMGASSSQNFFVLGGQVAKDQDALAMLSGGFNNIANKAQRQEAQELYERYSSSEYGLSHNHALAAAQLTALTNAHNSDDRGLAPSFGVAMSAISAATGRSLGFDGDALRNSDLRGPNTDGLRDEVQRGVGAGPQVADDFHEQVAANAHIPPAAMADGLPTESALVNQHHEQQMAAFEQRSAERQEAFNQPVIQRAQNLMMHSAPESGGAANLLGKWDNGTAWMERRAEQIGGGIIEHYKGMGGDFSGSLQQLSQMTPEQLEQYRAALDRGDTEFANNVTGGHVVVGAASIGRTIMGAGAYGSQAFMAWWDGDDRAIPEAVQGMSLQELGAFYSGAYVSAVNAGGGAAMKFMSEYGDNFKQVMQQIAVNEHGLRPEQAAIFAESYDTNKESMASKVRDLKMLYAEQDGNGRPILDENNQPVLSAHNEAFTDKMVSMLQESTAAGDRAGSYLTPIKAYNIASKDILDKDN